MTSDQYLLQLFCSPLCSTPSTREASYKIYSASLLKLQIAHPHQHLGRSPAHWNCWYSSYCRTQLSRSRSSRHSSKHGNGACKPCHISSSINYSTRVLTSLLRGPWSGPFPATRGQRQHPAAAVQRMVLGVALIQLASALQESVNGWRYVRDGSSLWAAAGQQHQCHVKPMTLWQGLLHSSRLPKGATTG